jgi:hypothetical protein
MRNVLKRFVASNSVTMFVFTTSSGKTISQEDAPARMLQET